MATSKTSFCRFGVFCTWQNRGEVDTSSAEWIFDEEINYSNTHGFSIKTSRLNEDELDEVVSQSVREWYVTHMHTHSII